MKKLRIGDRIPTEKELMSRFDVSKITVAKALTCLANDQVISRIPGKGSFVIDSGIQDKANYKMADIQNAKENEKSKQRTKIIGFVIPSISDYRLINGVLKTLSANSYRTMILLSEGITVKEKDALDTLKVAGAEGILFIPGDNEYYNDEILKLKFTNYPIVIIERFLPRVQINYIATDGKQGMHLAMEYLWGLGHREIAICSDSPLRSVTVKVCIGGYIEVLKSKGALINPAHIITGLDASCNEEENNQPLYFHIQNRMATAYITLDSKLSVLIYRIACQIGLQVPRDLSIISFGNPTSNSDEINYFTYIDLSEYEMGCRAAITIIDIIENNKGSRGNDFIKLLIAPTFEHGKTTGPPSKK